VIYTVRSVVGLEEAAAVEGEADATRHRQALLLPRVASNYFEIEILHKNV